MTAKVTRGAWVPLRGSLPVEVAPDRIYVIPTREALNVGADKDPRYTDNVRYLPKEARAANLPVEFSMPEGSRKYVQEFSIDPESWALGLALLTITNDWLLHVVGIFIQMRSKVQGWTSEQAHELPLKISIAKMDEGSGVSETYEIEGTGTEVLEALRILIGKGKNEDDEHGE